MEGILSERRLCYHHKIATAITKRSSHTHTHYVGRTQDSVRPEAVVTH